MVSCLDNQKCCSEKTQLAFLLLQQAHYSVTITLVIKWSTLLTWLVFSQKQTQAGESTRPHKQCRYHVPLWHESAQQVSGPSPRSTTVKHLRTLKVLAIQLNAHMSACKPKWDKPERQQFLLISANRLLFFSVFLSDLNYESTAKARVCEMTQGRLS